LYSFFGITFCGEIKLCITAATCFIECTLPVMLGKSEGGCNQDVFSLYSVFYTFKHCEFSSFLHLYRRKTDYATVFGSLHKYKVKDCN